MSSIGTGYDLSANQFSPDGRVFQVEYAMKAVENSSTAIAIRCRDGVIFAVEKLITSKLHESGTGHRIFNVDKHVGMAVAGVLADARQVVKIAREEAADYRAVFGSPIPLKYLVERVAGYIHLYTLYSAYRPFGCSILLSSYEHGKPGLYMIDPSGVFYGYWGCAIGKAKQNAQTEIEKLKVTDYDCKEAVNVAAKIIHIIHDEVKDKSFELEMSWVGEASGGQHEIVPKAMIQEAEDLAKKAMEEDSDSDEEL
ncbi:proteasome subunit alpha type-3-like [Rhopilema esculentum]|uniref:proteasome subunit alpha type-3-like n=1 Tax=Rhopilema esculentum TaxID=499914 RepID=UPI0031D00686|eukprot:gene3054-1337_t